MTQPPPPPNQPPGPPPNQPPNQPPQGGFGGPQEPPAGGFGAPTPPPQDGSYGYPQTPPPQDGSYGYPQTPPQGGGSYGYPQTQPQQQYGYPGAPTQGQPAYGAPQQGATAQQPYGYPTQPMQPAAPGPGGGGGGRRISTQMQIIIAAAVAIVLIVVGGIVYASSGDDGKKDEAKNSSGGASGDGGKDGGEGGKTAPDGAGTEKPGATTTSKVAYQLPEPAREDLTAVPGSWVTDKAFVKPGVNSVVGYDVAKGNALWTTPLAGQVCAGSRHVTEDNKTAILFEAKKRTAPKFYEKCTEVGVLDLTTGKLLWSKSVTGGAGGDGKTQFEQVTVSGGTVAAGGLYGGAAFDLNTGAERWKPTVDADNCRDIGYAGGKALVAVRTCGEYGNQTAVVQPVNAENGTPLSTYKMPAGVEDARVVSSDPLVVAADVGDTGTFGISDFFSIDAKTGKLLARIAAPGDKYLARCPASDGVEGCQFVVVGNGKLYLPTEEHDAGGDLGRTNEIVAFDLKTGKGTPERADAGAGYHALPLRMDGGNLIVYKWPPYNKGGQIVSINGATFEQTVLMDNPADRSVRDAETSFTENGSEYRYQGGRFFISQDLMSKPRASESTYGKKYLAIVFTVAD
ncbi:outer membrane protein assembly factor BamB family protein [Streptomyces zhihengii]